MQQLQAARHPHCYCTAVQSPRPCLNRGSRPLRTTRDWFDCYIRSRDIHSMLYSIRSCDIHSMIYSIRSCDIHSMIYSIRSCDIHSMLYSIRSHDIHSMLYSIRSCDIHSMLYSIRSCDIIEYSTPLGLMTSFNTIHHMSCKTIISQMRQLILYDHTWQLWSTWYGICNTSISCSTCF